MESITIQVLQDSDTGEYRATFGEAEGIGESLSDALIMLAEELHLDGQ
jgi:hypothetical protein